MGGGGEGGTCQSDDPLHHERTLLPQSYISLLRVEIRVRFAVCVNCGVMQCITASGKWGGGVRGERVNLMTHCTMSERSYHGATSRSLGLRLGFGLQYVSTVVACSVSQPQVNGGGVGGGECVNLITQ